jgi:molecular chaperone GrpE
LSQQSEAEELQEVDGAASTDGAPSAGDELFLNVEDSGGEEVVEAAPETPAAAAESATAGLPLIPPPVMPQPGSLALRVALESAQHERDALKAELAEVRQELSLKEMEAASASEALAAAERERDELKGRLVRQAADQDNFRKRIQREKEETLKYGASKIVMELLPAVDNMERALDHADKSSDVVSIVDGIKMVQRQLISALEKHGVVGFEAKGQPFDPQRHEAIQQIETSEHETGTVLQEYQRGYFLHDRLIRPALVVVARRTAAAAPVEQPDVIDVAPEAPAAEAAPSGDDQDW